MTPPSTRPKALKHKSNSLQAFTSLVLLILFSTISHSLLAETQGEKYIRIAATSYEFLMGVSPGKTKDFEQFFVDQHTLIEIGKATCLEYAKTHPEHAEFLNYVVEHADDLHLLDNEELERQWHKGEAPGKFGIEAYGDDHFKLAMNLADMIVHPSYTISLIKNYQKTLDKNSLYRAKLELSEGLGHAEILFGIIEY